jgi:hypothetical protein
MLVLLVTLIVTWIVHNWWKLLLLLIGVIVLHEYQVRKYSKGNNQEDAEEETAADAPAEAVIDTEDIIEEDRLT